MNRTLPYRPLLALLALVLFAGVASAFPADESAGHDCCQGHEAHERCPMTQAADDAVADEEVPVAPPAEGATACCSSAPAAPAPAAVVPAAPVSDAPVAVVVGRLPQPSASSASPRAADTGPPVSSLRSHLAFSVLLI